MKLSSKSIAGKLGLTTASAIVAAFSITAQAESYGSPSEYLQVEHGYTEMEAEQRIRAERDSALARRKAKELIGEQYAGSWFSPEYNALVVAVTDDSVFELVEAIGAVPIRHEHSLQRLDREKVKLDVFSRSSSNAGSGIGTWYVDVMSNALVVEHLPGSGDQARNFVAEVGIEGVPVRFKAVDETSVLTYDIEGGDEFYNVIQSFPCSIGFSIIDGYITAGHCGENQELVNGHNGVSQGYYAAEDWPSTDRAWVSTNSNWTPKPKVNGYSHGTLNITGDLTGFLESPVNATVCRYGRTTFARCGIVKAHNVSHPFGIAVRLYGLTRTTACIDFGDSGGPFLSSSGYYAQGTTIGGDAGTCPNPANYSYFEPARGTVSAYSKVLLTQHGANPPSTKNFVCPDPGLGGNGIFFCSTEYESQGSTSLSWSASTGDSMIGTLSFSGTCSAGTTVYVDLDMTNPYGTTNTSTSFSCP